MLDNRIIAADERRQVATTPSTPSRPSAALRDHLRTRARLRGQRPSIGIPLMIDPCTYWTRVMSAWGAVGATGGRLGETAIAAQAVIVARTTTIGEAMRAPLSGDYAELGRMIPEKVVAFSQSGTAGSPR